LPLGVKGHINIFNAMRQAASGVRSLLAYYVVLIQGHCSLPEPPSHVTPQAVKKNKLLLINNSGWRHRAAINEMIAAKFGLPGNAYSSARPVAGHQGTNSDQASNEPYQFQVARAKFVLCPSGMGWDTYRHWEVLLMGSIPVMESSPGFDRTFTALPVLIVQSFDEVTPELLERTYVDFVRRHREWDYARLTRQYWMDLVFKVAETGDVRAVVSRHPLDAGGRPR